VVTRDAQLASHFAAEYNAASLRIRPAPEFAARVDGREAVPPRLIPTRARTEPGPHRGARSWCGAARKP